MVNMLGKRNPKEYIIHPDMEIKDINGQKNKN